ncbi:hypothetical protein NPIL_197451 [Nephila pilipes]|uniref:Uncharacterized protein n=1 Tax=Nephila pilipes TaxID=299642 RepID=A0A8X6PS73_NEPPI|nr:hypothetical protein NPIL_76221 [Nephila pilipes]GFT85840.1 hypothetical protein NPIL_197451 [Nephila pilipes]
MSIPTLQEMVLDKVADTLYNNSSFKKSAVPMESENWIFPPDEELPIMRRTVSNLAVPKTIQKKVIRKITHLSANRQLEVQMDCMERILALEPISETWDLSRQQARLKLLLKVQEKLSSSTARGSALLADECDVD